MTGTSKVDSTTTMIYPTDAVERKDAQTEYFKLDNAVIILNDAYDWLAPKAVDRHHITTKKFGSCDYKDRIVCISVPLHVMKSKEDIVSTWYIMHECAHAIAIKLKNFTDHGKFFHHVLIELMELFVTPDCHEAFVSLETSYKKRMKKRWENWKKWRNKDDNHREVFPATLPVFRESQRRAIGSH